MKLFSKLNRVTHLSWIGLFKCVNMRCVCMYVVSIKVFTVAVKCYHPFFLKLSLIITFIMLNSHVHVMGNEDFLLKQNTRRWKKVVEGRRFLNLVRFQFFWYSFLEVQMSSFVSSAEEIPRS